MAALLDAVLKAPRRSADCNVCSFEEGKKNPLIYAFQTSKNLKRDYWNLHTHEVCNAELIQFVHNKEKISFSSGRHKSGSAVIFN